MKIIQKLFFQTNGLQISQKAGRGSGPERRLDDDVRQGRDEVEKQGRPAISVEQEQEPIQAGSAPVVPEPAGQRFRVGLVRRAGPKFGGQAVPERPLLHAEAGVRREKLGGNLRRGVLKGVCFVN